MTEKNDKQTSTIKRIGGHLHRVTPIFDSAGNIVHHAVTPFMVELRPRDVMQIVVGSSILAIPLSFTEEVWNLGSELPVRNIAILGVLSIGVITLYVYFNFYRHSFLKNWFDCIKRIVATYVISLLVVAGLLTVITKCPWETDPLVALKRIILVAFPASFMATVTDSLK